MYFTYAEKQGNVFFDGWKVRQIAFDTMRRYMYYSSGDLQKSQIAEPNSLPYARADAHRHDMPRNNSSIEDSMSLVSSPTLSSPRAPMPRLESFAPSAYEVPDQPNLPNEVVWKRKIKVDMIVLVAKEHSFLLEDPHVKENDLFQVEIHGQLRPLQTGEAPAPGPLLCPSTGLAGLPSRMCAENEDYIQDPFFFNELYESLRDQFNNLRIERELLESTGQQPDPRFARIQTIQSPRKKNESVAKGSPVKVVLRMRNEYEFRRFWFVVQSVIGYDKFSPRPYRGLPPRDPRNGIVFAQIPMCVWHTFKSLDKAVIHTFVRADLIGRSLQGEITEFLRGAYLCITHDTVLVLRDSGNIPRWIKLQEVREFHYNSECRRPYVAFLSDPGAPDIIIVPQPPVYGSDAIRRFSPKIEVLRMLHVVRETCFASIEIRRVIQISEAPEHSVRSFIDRVETDQRRQLNFDPAVNYTGAMGCPIPKEQLANVWREVQDMVNARDAGLDGQAAIPLYNNNTNDNSLTAAHLTTVSRRLDRERRNRDQVVGMPYDEARSVPTSPLMRRRTQSQGHSHTHTQVMGAAAASMRRTNTDSSAQLSTTAFSSTANPNSASVSVQRSHNNNNNNNSSSMSVSPTIAPTLAPASLLHEASPLAPNFSPPTSSASSTFQMAASVEYAVPGARYISREELGAACATHVGGHSLVVEHHAIVMGQTPMAAHSLIPMLGGNSLHNEMTVEELMCRSFAMRSAGGPGAGGGSSGGLKGAGKRKKSYSSSRNGSSTVLPSADTGVET